MTFDQFSHPYVIASKNTLVHSSKCTPLYIHSSLLSDTSKCNYFQYKYLRFLHRKVRGSSGSSKELANFSHNFQLSSYFNRRLTLQLIFFIYFLFGRPKCVTQVKIKLASFFSVNIHRVGPKVRPNKWSDPPEINACTLPVTKGDKC